MPGRLANAARQAAAAKYAPEEAAADGMMTHWFDT